MNKGPNHKFFRRPESPSNQCPHCKRPQQNQIHHRRPPKQEFSPLERIGITINNKLGTTFNSRSNRRPAADINNLDCGDHISVDRFQPMTYTHHGLYLGFGMVIHYDFHEITVVTLDEFAKGHKVYKVDSPIAYPAEMVMARAATRIGEKRYNIMTNNCEHFVRWCRNGKEIKI